MYAFGDVSRDLLIKHTQRDTDELIYEQIKVRVEQMGGKVRSKTFVMVAIKPRQIRLAPLPTKSTWMGGCPHCQRMKELLSKMPLPIDQLVELEQLQKHAQLSQHQIEFFKERKQQLRSKQCIIVQDFSKFYVTDGKVNDLILTIYWKQDGELKWKYLDHFSKEKQSFAFVRAAWVRLFEDTEELKDFDEIEIISDGGPQHFKIGKTLYLFSTFHDKYNKLITYHFFGSYHGHSICDSHTGVQKQNLLRVERATQKQTPNMEAVVNQATKLKNTTPVILTSIDPNVPTQKLKYSEGIKPFHEYCFVGAGKMKCRKQSGVGPYTDQDVE